MELERLLRRWVDDMAAMATKAAGGFPVVALTATVAEG